MEKKTEPAKATEKAAGKKQAEKTRYFYLDREITAEEAGALSEPVVRGTAPGQGPSAKTSGTKFERERPTAAIRKATYETAPAE